MAQDIESRSRRRLHSNVKFGVLGPVTVTEGTTTLNIGGPKQRTVLALLIAHAGDPVSTESIIEAVWGGDSAPNAKRIVQTYVATLRAEVGDAIVRAGQGWRLEAPRDGVDSLAFEDLYQTARDVAKSNPQRASAALREALAMWRGHPYSDIEAHGALEGESSRLSGLRLAAQAARMDADLALGRDVDLVGEIEALIAQHPYFERFRAQHMLALYRAGRQQESLRSYEQLRTILLEELGVDPTPDLQDLERRILEQDDSLRVSGAQTIQRRAILVADPGDPIELGHLPGAERDELLSKSRRAVQSAIERDGGGISVTAGATNYVVFENPQSAVSVAEAVTRRLDDNSMRMAIDWGDVVIENGRVSGPPVSRAAVMAAVAHKGQVLLSADAQQAVGTSGSGRGLRFESLGSYQLHGVEDVLLIYQLLVGDMPAMFPELETYRLPPPLPGGADRSVPGYELREALAPGSIGTLHRAFQPTVGREVLIEVIGRSAASDADFVRNFEADAQRLSLLDHQNIAAVIDYWRQPDGAFLVYRYPRGGLLSQGVETDANRVIDHVGSALTYAHSLGMIHGSTRPDLIALDEAGNASVLCFPVAGVAPPVSSEYAAYIAPEVAAGERSTVTSDVFSLGVLARELLSSGHPAIDKATAADPSDRQASIAEFLIELNPGDEPSPADRYTEGRNPYKGLVPFSEMDSGDFFGRGTAVTELIEGMRDSGLLAIVGPSGVGKSSVARAGLIPSLRTEALPGSAEWVITDMLPESHPFLELQRALERVAVDLPIELTEALVSQDADALADASRAMPEQSELLVLVDQFEELFTMTEEDERGAFLEMMQRAVERSHVRFIVTLRADFLDKPLRYSEFGALLKSSTVMLSAPNPKELADAITKPARGVGVEVAPELVERMVAEVHGQPGALPLLQHALSELFVSRDSDLIGLETFEEIGGVTGSVARRAETIFKGLSGEEQSRIKQVFLRLVTVVDDGAPTRRRIRMTELPDLDAQPGIESFAKNRLLVFDNDPETRTPTVEVAHEALLTHWPRLADWIDAIRGDLTLSRRLDEAIRDWEDNAANDAYLLTGGRLAQHQSWTSSTSLVLTTRQEEFLEASRIWDEELKRRARRRRAWIMGGFAAAAAVAAVLAVAAMHSATQAAGEQLAAHAVTAQATDSELSLLLGLEAYRRSPSPSTMSAIHHGIQGHRARMFIPPAEGAIGARGIVDPDGSRIALVGDNTSVVQMWPIGASEPGWEVNLTDDPLSAFRTWSLAWFSADGSSVFIPLSGDDRPGGPGAGLYTIDADSGEIVGFWGLPCLSRAMPAGSQNVELGGLWAFDFLRGCGSPVGGAAVVDIETHETVFETPPYVSGTPVTLSGDGRLVTASGDFPDNLDDLEAANWFKGTRIYDTTTGSLVREIPGRSAAVISIDGSLILAGSDPTFLYDVATGDRLQTYQGTFTRFGFSPDGTRVIGNSPSGVVKIFDTGSGAELMTLRGHAGAPRTSSITADGEVLVSSGLDGAFVWDVAETLLGDLNPIDLEPIDHQRFYLDALSRVDGYLLVRRAPITQASSVQQTIPQRVDVLRLEDESLVWSGDVWAAELGPGGVLFVQPVLESPTRSPSGADAVYIGAPQLVDLENGDVIRELDGCEHYWVPLDDPEPGSDCREGEILDYFNLQFSADGSTLLGATWLGAFTIWDVSSGEIIREYPADLEHPRLRLQGYRWSAALSPDGKHVAIPPSEDEWVQFAANQDPAEYVVEEVETGTEVGHFQVDSWVDYLAYEPDSGRLIGSHADLIVVEPGHESGELLTRSQGSRINDLDISPNGKFVATVTFEQAVVVWDIENGRVIAEFPISGDAGEGLRGVAFVDDQTIVVAPETGPQLLRFTLDPDTVVDIATDNLTRGFRPEECATYVIEPCPTLAQIKARS